MRNEASSKECTANSILPVRINLFLDYFLHWIIKSHFIHLWSIQMDTLKKLELIIHGYFINLQKGSEFHGSPRMDL